MDKDHIVEPLRHLAVPIESLHFDPKNARKHDSKNMDAIQASLEKFGQVEPIVVQKQGMIVRAGNGRLAVAHKLGWPCMAAVVVDQTDADAAAFAIADNRTGELGEWDYEALFSVLKESSVDLTELGFSEGEMSALETEFFSASVDSIDLGIGEEKSEESSEEEEGYTPRKVPSLGHGDDTSIRRVMLYMPQEQYDELLEHFAIAEHDLGTTDHSTVVLTVLRDRYGTPEQS